MVGAHLARRGFDVIVVGGGSAGCVIAARLAEDADRSVLLLEQGGSNNGWTVRMPGATGENYRPGSRYMAWQPTEPQPHLGGRVVDMPTGRGLGGSSLVNGMVYIRGHPLDFRRWEAEGARGWSFDNVLPYFKRMEDWRGRPNDFRAVGGPIGVRVKEDLDPLSAAFLEAGRQAGHPFTDDVNGMSQEGVCRFDMNIDGGYRASSSYAYLEKRSGPRNLSILLGATAHAVVIEHARAIGVDVAIGDRREQFRAEREIVVCAGAVGSPKLLMVSGIGGADMLRRVGIDPIHDLPSVGKNLHDHLELDLQWSCPTRYAFNRLMRPHRMAAIGLQWLLLKRGFGATNQVYVGAFLRSNSDVEYANVQFHFVPVYMDGWLPTAGTAGFRVGAGPARPSSRGYVAIRSGDPHDRVVLDPNYLATEEDRRQMRESYDLIHGIVSQRAFDPFRGPPIDPPELPKSREHIDAMVRHYMGAGFHLCGTCRMGRSDDPEAVVDCEGRVLGLEGLRVVDASIMPSIVTGNPNATVMMMAERLSDLIRGRAVLPPKAPKREDRATSAT